MEIPFFNEDVTLAGMKFVALRRVLFVEILRYHP